MKYKIKSIFVSLLLSTGLTSLGQEKVTTYVNPFIGTGAVESSLSGNNYPGATVPFGMVQLSPDTRVAPDWGEACGYNHNDQVIVGFSHTRLSGTGAADFIDILLMPMTRYSNHRSTKLSGTGHGLSVGFLPRSGIGTSGLLPGHASKLRYPGRTDSNQPRGYSSLYLSRG